MIINETIFLCLNLVSLFIGKLVGEGNKQNVTKNYATTIIFNLVIALRIEFSEVKVEFKYFISQLNMVLFKIE